MLSEDLLVLLFVISENEIDTLNIYDSNGRILL